MLTTWLIAAAVIGGLLLERITITRLTRSPRGRAYIRRTPWLHPNGISLLRMPMGVIGVWMAHVGWWEAATLFFAFWMISDLTDGTIARNCDLETETGKWLDPLSDKFMYFPPLIYCAAATNVRIPLPWTWVVVLLLIDALGQASRLVIHKKAANYFGKAKTAFITIVLACTALDQVYPLWFMSDRFVEAIMLSSALLAFMSVYCRVIPDRWYANNLTLANFLCGCAALWSVQCGHPLRAFVMVFLGQFFDLFDGRLARIFGSTRHGPIFDDIADGTSFGLAIGYLVLMELLEAGVPMAVAAGVALIYLGCVVYRLYRFLRPTQKTPPGIFEGMPSPAGAMMAGSSVLLFGSRWTWLATGLVLATSLLMVSTLRYRHFARRIWPSLPRTGKLLVCVLLLIFVDVALSHKNYALFFNLFCFGLAMAYMVGGLDPQTYLPKRWRPALPADDEPSAERPGEGTGAG